MHVDSPAIVCAVRPHGETGAIARLLTPDDGLQRGYVRGGRSRRLRPVLHAGNLVEAAFRARTEAQLAALTVELTRSRAPLAAEPLAAAAIEWSCGLAATTLPEGQPYPRIFQALDGLLAAVEAAPSARGWGPALVRYELLLLAELGFGLDLSHCVASGAREDLAFVSPRSGHAVSRAEGAPYSGRLLRLPGFLLSGAGQAGWDEVIDGLRLSGHFIERDLLAGPRAVVLDARTRLVDRLRAIAG